MSAFSSHICVYMFSSISRDLHVLSVAKYYPTLGKILMYTDVTSSQSTCTLIRFGNHLMTLGA